MEHKSSRICCAPKVTCPVSHSTLLPIPLTELRARACLDYITIGLEVNAHSLIKADKRHKWNYVDENDTWNLTVHDPTKADLIRLVEVLDDPYVVEFELSVDFWPAPDVSPELAPDLLRAAFVALAARFRPEERLMHGAGFKGAFSDWRRPKPFHNRLPKPNETLVYSHRCEEHQAKAYLKRKDQNKLLPEAEHRIRLETRVGQFHMSEFGLGRVSSLMRAGLRGKFCKVFRIVDRPAVRDLKKLDPSQRAAMERRMWVLWNKSGVGAFEEPPLPPDASSFARTAAQKRRVETLSNPRRLALDKFKMHRDVAANDEIGNALRQLDRRLAR
jgi:hypothetical protein